MGEIIMNWIATAIAIVNSAVLVYMALKLRQTFFENRRKGLLELQHGLGSWTDWEVTPRWMCIILRKPPLRRRWWNIYSHGWQYAWLPMDEAVGG